MNLLLLSLVGCTPENAVLLADAGPDRIIEVGQTLTLDASLSMGAVEYAWTFGDGRRQTSDSPLVSHGWDEPGHYTVYLEINDELGRTATDSLRLTVHHALLPTPPRSSTTLVSDPTGRLLFALLPDSDRIAVVDTDTARLLGHVETCTHPRSISANEERLAVACPDVDAVRIYSLTETLPIVDIDIDLDWGSRPFGVVFGEDSIYLTLQGTGELLNLDMNSGTEIDRITVGSDPRGLAWSSDHIAVSRHRSPDEGGEWWLVDTDDSSVRGYRLDPDPGPDSDTNARGVPGYLQRLAFRPDGRTLLLPGLKSNIERGRYVEGRDLSPDSTVRAILGHVNLDPDAGDIGAREEEPLFDNRDLASAVAYTPIGDTIFVAHLGARIIDALDAWTLQRIGGFRDVGHGLSGLWVDPEGTVLWALVDFDRELVAFPISDSSASPSETARIDLLGDLEEPLDATILEGKRLFYAAADPRMSHDSYISCGSCHLDGDDDGRTWDFTERGEGLRNTISLQGRSHEGHGPLHWSGNFDEVQDFENDIRLHMGGEGFLSEDDWLAADDPLGIERAGMSSELDALALFVATLDRLPRSPWRTPDGELEPEAERGRLLFEDPRLGCTECHGGPEFSDSGWNEDGEPLLHDVGTIGEASGGRMGEELSGLDTPSLRGLHASAPYLHDGSAPDLEAVLIDSNPDGLHGDTRMLTDDELTDLIVYLSSLE